MRVLVIGWIGFQIGAVICVMFLLEQRALHLNMGVDDMFMSTEPQRPSLRPSIVDAPGCRAEIRKGVFCA